MLLFLNFFSIYFINYSYKWYVPLTIMSDETKSVKEHEIHWLNMKDGFLITI